MKKKIPKVLKLYRRAKREREKNKPKPRSSVFKNRKKEWKKDNYGEVG
jgi:hypothetical protein